jgi:hypothetical protein
LPESPKGDARIPGKIQKVRERLRVNGAIDNILSEDNCITFIWGANSNPPELNMNSENVFPPKRAFFPCQMRNIINIVFFQMRLTQWIFSFL